MSTKMEELALELLSLPASTRGELALRLIRSLDETEAPGVESHWLEEIDRRDAEIRAGKVECVPAEEVLRRARERLK